jgi:hypothetical protein
LQPRFDELKFKVSPPVGKVVVALIPNHAFIPAEDALKGFGPESAVFFSEQEGLRISTP